MDLCCLHYRTMLELTGADTAKLLNNILTNRIEENLLEDKLTYALLLSPVGKVLYDFFIFKKDNKIYLDVSSHHVNEIIHALTIYTLRLDVFITHLNDCSVYVSKNTQEGFFVDPRNKDLGFRGYQHLQEADLGNECIEEYVEKRLNLSLPEFHLDFASNTFYPLDLSMDTFNAISFDKGCYTGQEVVAKMHYRGKKKKVIKTILLQNYKIISNELYNEDKKIGVLLSEYGDKGIALLRNQTQ